MNTFRVLVVDDKKIVLDRIKYDVEHKVKVGDEDWKVEIVTLHVKVEGDDKKEEFYIDESTIAELGKASKNPFDLILLDFGYKKENSPIIQKIIDKYGKDANLSKLDGKLLNPYDLIKASIDICNKKKNKEYLKNIKNNFINHKKEIIIYTYTQPNIKKFFPSTAIRENITFDSFPSSKKIELLDTSLELFNDEEFTEKFDEKYYSYLIARYLNKIIQFKIAEESIIHSKYIKVTRTTKSISLIILIGGLIGAISEYIGSLMIKFVEQDQILPAILLLLFIIIVGVFLGKILIDFLEKRLKKLFIEESHKNGL